MYYRKGPWIGCCIGCKCHQTSASVKAPPTVTQEEPVEDEHVYNVPLLAIPTMKKNKQRPKFRVRKAKPTGKGKAKGKRALKK
mmetsp:Transcript_2098/g.3074  ORF Transcript_2098/g.3074 Transcript_2098/m.3074 type:complete len:83 (-) Transcript_2098:42-290(-)